MDSQVAQNQWDRIALNKTIYESAIGRNLVEAAQSLLDDQDGFFDDIARFEILSARRISTSFRVQYTGHVSADIGDCSHPFPEFQARRTQFKEIELSHP